MKTVSLITAGTLIAVGTVVVPTLNFVPSHATVEVGANTVEATETIEGVRLEWELVDPEATIQILNNGEIVAEADSSGSIVDPGALEGIEEYQVVVGEPAEITDFESDVPEDIENFAHIVTVPLKIGDEVTLAARASGNTPVTTFRYQTFIPTKYVEGSVFCGPNFGSTLFNGNDRLWNPWSTNNKTRFDVTVDWRNGGSLKSTLFVGETRTYSGTVDSAVPFGDPATASTAGMKLEVHYASEAAANFTMKHDVANPLCIGALGINYSANVRVWRASGSYRVTANIRTVPNHEFYVKDSDEAEWLPIWKLSYARFQCLHPVNNTNSWCYRDLEDGGARW
ncbi:MAG: hypothetical protein RL431_930 [Actinomycetota bacterium]|jgi:hypothetical protein